MKKASQSIRVNLRFGPRTDPALIREIAALAPYRRAKRLRQLLEAGWRARQEIPSPTPARSPSGVTTHQLPESSEGSFAQDLLALVGQSVRL